MKLNETILKKVRQREEKFGISYAKTDGSLYKTLSVLYIIAASFLLLMNIMFIFGMTLIVNNDNAKEKIITSIIAVAISTVFIVVGFVLNRLKLFIPSGILSVAFNVFELIFLGNGYYDITLKLKFSNVYIIRFLIPLIIMLILIVWMTVIGLKAKVKTNKEYKKILNNLYESYHNDPEAIEKYGSWEEFLEKDSSEEV